MSKTSTLIKLLIVLAVLTIILVTYTIGKKVWLRDIDGFDAPVPIPTISASTTSGSAESLNANWRMILTYLKENPDRAATFIADVREKFFNVDSCPIKIPRIDFEHLDDSYRPVFT